MKTYKTITGIEVKVVYRDDDYIFGYALVNPAPVPHIWDAVSGDDWIDDDKGFRLILDDKIINFNNKRSD
jgi:hypothetical protein